MIKKIIGFFLAMLVSLPLASCAAPPPTLVRELSADGHLKVSVEAEAVVLEQGGAYLVTTTYRGKELVKLLGVEEIYKTELTHERPIIGKEEIVIEILDPDLVVPDDISVPNWTYEVYGNPALISPVYVKADPINLVIDLPMSLVDHEFEDEGWGSSPNWNILSAKVNYILYEGSMIPQAKNYFLDSDGSERYHVRVWRCGDVLVGQAHIDTGLPHSAYAYEKAENMAVRAFSLHITRRNCIWLSNKCKDHKGYTNNGWASYITTYKYYL